MICEWPFSSHSVIGAHPSRSFTLSCWGPTSTSLGRWWVSFHQSTRKRSWLGWGPSVTQASGSKYMETSPGSATLLWAETSRPGHRWPFSSSPLIWLNRRSLCGCSYLIHPISYRGIIQAVLYINSTCKWFVNYVVICTFQVFQICYCTYYSPDNRAEWEAICQEFVSSIHHVYPSFTRKPKIHLILHLVESMEQFAPTAAFNTER